MEKKLEIVVNYDVNLPCGLVGDSEKIRRIFSCLVNNAIKFTEKGCVTLKNPFIMPVILRVIAIPSPIPVCCLFFLVSTWLKLVKSRHDERIFKY